ncbi:hypothetical protein GWI33_010142 [Rhynchophorus ferrugineus]|uniref:EDR1/CTR1/ARMC3-like peptidase-like domain-containing protein n=1 Tax=Rhynchophorus ferrugineus TaxID=354439 RepID=A0A834IRB6_RHYFE|nr:hypothetical protein GWI33_010142 [Rhynchophorus ferrugineus]
MSKQTGKADQTEKNKSAKLDKAKQSDIKEKVYNTKQVETSITILESPETDVVLEALLFLSKYADISKNNPVYLTKKGLIEKLVKNMDKNICILRLSLRLLAELLGFDEGLYEIDQEMYDETFLRITDMYIEHKDVYIRQYCVEILSKVATIPRIIVLIFKTDLLNPVLENMKVSKNAIILYHTLLLFYRLMDIPSAVSQLSECKNFDPNIVIHHINNDDIKISNIVLDIIEKMSSYGLPFIQESFKNVRLVEKVLSIIMKEETVDQHDKALNILKNCLACEETNNYFVESVEFLDLCQWVKTCHPRYLIPLIEVFLILTSMNEMKQTLFDLSVEESILSFFRYSNKILINKVCQAVSNMTTHKYCCEHMLTPVVAATLVDILNRQADDDDSQNEVALRTIYDFMKRNCKALDIFFQKQFKSTLLNYFFTKSMILKEDSFQMILEILYKYLVHPILQKEFLSSDLYKELLKLFQQSSTAISNLCCEILTYLLMVEEFRKSFLDNGGIRIFLDKVGNCEEVKLVTEMLYFVYSSLVYDDIAMAFLHGGLVSCLRDMGDYLISKIPLIKKVLLLAFNYYLPIKFFDSGRLEVIDKLPNKFYLIHGPWNGPFPFLDILERMFVSPYQTIYLVDFSYEVDQNASSVNSQSSLTLSRSLKSSDYSVTNINSLDSLSIMLSASTPSVLDVNYGKISPDPFLPRYIYHIRKYEKFLGGSIQDRCKFLAEYVDTLLCGPRENLTLPQKIHEYKVHIECLKTKLGNNIIPIGYLRLGFHCERALLFKALADKVSIPCSLVKGNLKVYWNEVAAFEGVDTNEKVRFYVVDLIDNLGDLLLVGSREANKYCNLN